MVGQVAKEGEGLSFRLDYEHVVAEGVSRRRDGRHARQEFLAILEEHDAVAHRHQVLAGVGDEILQRSVELLLIGPEFQIGLADIDLCVREQRLAAFIDDAADMVDMRV